MLFVVQYRGFRGTWRSPIRRVQWQPSSTGVARVAQRHEIPKAALCLNARDSQVPTACGPRNLASCLAPIFNRSREELALLSTIQLCADNCHDPRPHFAISRRLSPRSTGDCGRLLPERPQDAAIALRKSGSAARGERMQ
jgi:hypothetical protein